MTTEVEIAFAVSLVWPASFALVSREIGRPCWVGRGRRRIVPWFWGVHGLFKFDNFKVNPKRVARLEKKYIDVKKEFFKSRPKYVEKMKRYWPNFKKRKDRRDFWKSEMDKHKDTGMSPTKYIRVVLRIAKYLQRGDFFPTKKENSTMVFGKPCEFTLAQLRALPFKVHIHVQQLEGSPLPIIHEVKIFLDKKFEEIPIPNGGGIVIDRDGNLLKDPNLVFQLPTL